MRVSKLHKKLFNEFGEGEFCLINREFFHKRAEPFERCVTRPLNRSAKA